LAPYAKLSDKPVIASWMGGPDVHAARAILNQAGIQLTDIPMRRACFS
jgi:acetyltransferase